MLIKRIYQFKLQKEPKNKDVQLTLFRLRLHTDRVPSPLNNKRKLKKKRNQTAMISRRKKNFKNMLLMKHITRICQQWYILCQRFKTKIKYNRWITFLQIKVPQITQKMQTSLIIYIECPSLFSGKFTFIRKEKPLLKK